MKREAFLKTHDKLIVSPFEAFKIGGVNLVVRTCEWESGLGTSIAFEIEEQEEQPKQEVEQPKHTKVEYVKVTDSIFDLKEEFERGELYYLPNKPDNYKVIDKMNVLCHCAAYAIPHIYRKVVTELSERELVIEQAEKLTSEYGNPLIAELYDLDMLKLQKEG